MSPLTGFYVHKGDATATVTFEFPRSGPGANFALNIQQLLGSPTLTALVEHKSVEDTTWTTLATFASITTTGLKTISASGAKELLRYNFVITATNTYDGVYMQILPPSWYP